MDCFKAGGDPGGRSENIMNPVPWDVFADMHNTATLYLDLIKRLADKVKNSDDMDSFSMTVDIMVKSGVNKLGEIWVKGGGKG